MHWTLTRSTKTIDDPITPLKIHPPVTNPENIRKKKVNSNLLLNYLECRHGLGPFLKDNSLKSFSQTVRSSVSTSH